MEKREGRVEKGEGRGERGRGYTWNSKAPGFTENYSKTEQQRDVCLKKGE